MKRPVWVYTHTHTHTHTAYLSKNEVWKELPAKISFDYFNPYRQGAVVSQSVQ